jgi:hypothetical protein
MTVMSIGMAKSDDSSLNALTLLCLEGLLAVIESIARRCPLTTSTRGKGLLESIGPTLAPAIQDMSSPLSSVRDSESDTDGYSEAGNHEILASSGDQQLAWLHTARERTNANGQKTLCVGRGKFNTDHKNWMSYAQEMELLPSELTPESVARQDSTRH